MIKKGQDWWGDFLRSIHGIEESDTWQAIIEEGMTKARQEDILRLGRKKLGEPPPAVPTAITSVTDPDRLAYLIRRLLDVSSWDELFAVP